MNLVCITGDKIMTKIKREPTNYSVYLKGTRIKVYAFDFYGERMAEYLAKAFVDGYECGANEPDEPYLFEGF